VEFSDDRIAELIAYACEAPSAYNLQNWRFIAVKSPAAKQRLCERAYGQRQVLDAAVTIIVIGTLNGHESIRANIEPMVGAGLLSEQELRSWVEDTQRDYEADPRKQRDEAIRSASLAAMTLMAAAQGMGLASGPMGGFDAEAVHAEFGLGPAEIPVMLVAIGRAAADNWPRKPRRHALDLLSIA
jgi:nitroreductase